MTPDPELLKNYMMRGSLTGPAAPESQSLKMCAGIIDGRRCRVTVLTGDLCMSCQRTPQEPIKEMPKMATNIKKYICIEPGCNKVQCRANRCTVHYREHMRRGPDERAASIVVQIEPTIEPIANQEFTKSATACAEYGCFREPVDGGEFCDEHVREFKPDPASFGVFAVGMGDRSEPCDQAGLPAEPETLEEMQEKIAAVTAPAWEAAEWDVTINPTLSPALAALVVTPERPLPDTSVILDLGPMYETLVDQGVGTVTILELLDTLFVSKTYGLVRHAAV